MQSVERAVVAERVCCFNSTNMSQNLIIIVDSRLCNAWSNTVEESMRDEDDTRAQDGEEDPHLSRISHRKHRNAS